MARLTSGALLVAIMVLGAGCASDQSDQSDQSGQAPSSSSTTRSAGPSTSGGSTAPDVACGGLGPAATTGEVTWTIDGKLFDRSGCLLDLGRDQTLGGWGGKADRAVVGDTVVVEGKAPVQPLGGGPLILSKPTGTAVLRVTNDGKLLKREVASGEAREITFLASHEAAAYHPAGHSIVSSGKDASGGAALAIADNQGRDPRPLLTLEDAKQVGNPTFTVSGALLYTAEHDDHSDLHRLVIGEDSFSTVDSVKAPGTIGDVTASPFTGGGVAWTKGDCSSATPPTLRAERGGTFLALEGTEAEHARPVGWLPDGGLVAVSGQICKPTQPGTLLVVSGGKVQVLARGVTSAAVRAVLPPPPPPPRSIPQQAPA